MISFNLFLIIYLVFFLSTSILDLVLEILNVNHVKKHGRKVPDAFLGIIDRSELIQMTSYTLDNTRFSMIRTCTGKAVFLFIILSGILPWLAFTLADSPFILAGLIFFAVPGVITFLTDLPFDYFHSFVIEEKYGFNTRTLKIWLSDQLKTILLAAVLGTFLLSCLFFMVQYAGPCWWLWIWAVFLGFQLMITELYPTLIAPLFNKFTPIDDPELVNDIRGLSESEGLSVGGIFKMDASKRSRHTNAYFSGLGRTKRIVLFDSLVHSHERDEILAVLAHEIGHFKKNHIKKHIALIAFASFLLLYLASNLIGWEPMYRAFGFSVRPAYAGLFLLGILWEPVGFFLGPLGTAVSRRFERDADAYGSKAIGSAIPLIRALKKMGKDNLSNLYPHPLYVRFIYSHPPLLERIGRLQSHEGANP